MSKTPDDSRRMHKEMQIIMEHARSLVEATSGELDDRVKSARAALDERLESARHEYGELENELMEQVKAADAFMHAKPYYAIGGTLIAGLFLGWFISRQ
ncbi:MAG: DUF883 family protein [Desulfobacteraceae bacterium]|nr:MAG: DUF883 family protein [Desulfobacteraceae bacterium]